MSVMLVLDVVIITLLVVAIIYAVVLDNHLSATKENYRMLSHLIEQFYQASQRIQEELSSVQQSENEMKQSLMVQIDKASLIKEELVLLLQRIEDKTHTMDSLKLRRSHAMSSQPMMQSVQDLDLSDSERELLNTLNELR